MFEEDLDAFFDDFGVAVVFTSDGDPVATATLIFDAPSSEINVYDRSFYDEKFYEARVQGQSVTLHGSAASTANVEVGDTAEPDGQGEWVVTAKEPDGTGLMLIHLSANSI